MSTFTSEPGTKLGGRYRLEDRVAAAAGWAAWKAIDEILARAVTVITFAPGFPRIGEVVTAARAASRLTDARLAQVFDVEEDWDRAYVVMEWAAGDTLGDLLAAGPMEPATGARIVAEAAAALSIAHAAGLAHLCLTPESLRWTTGGGVKVTGLGVDAALAGVSADDPASADTRALGQLLYATLTGLWPGPDYPALPSAPLSDGQPRSPRQVRAGVPAALDEVACQALRLPCRGERPALTAPGALASRLAAVIPPDPVPPATPRPAQRQGARPPGGRSHRTAEPTGNDRWQPRSRRRGAGSKVRVAVITLLSLIVLSGVVAATSPWWHKNPVAVGSSSPSTRPSAAISLLTPVAAAGFDPLTSVTVDPSNENSDQAQNVLDGNRAGWATQQYYTSPYFGGLKQGSGLILNMGRVVRISSITVQFANIPGAEAEIKIGNSDLRSPANLASMTNLTPDTAVAGSHIFTVTSKVSGQYIVIWFTKLPPISSGSNTYMGQVYSVRIQGTAA